MPHPRQTNPGMRRRSSGSSEDGDHSPVEAPNVTPSQTDQSSVAPGQSHKKLDPPRPSQDYSRPSSARSRRSGNFNWKPAQARNGSIDKLALPSSTQHPSSSLLGMGASATSDQSHNMEKMAEPRSPGRRPGSRNPWAISILALLGSVAGIAVLGVILHSLVTRQLDPKGCRMSYMRPSYARLDDFDTEHTRFASKYSLYLYREQGVDDDSKVRFSSYRSETPVFSVPPVRPLTFATSSLEVSRFSSCPEMREVTSRFGQ